jgi:hypothetical protein
MGGRHWRRGVRGLPAASLSASSLTRPDVLRGDRRGGAWQGQALDWAIMAFYHSNPRFIACSKPENRNSLESQATNKKSVRHCMSEDRRRGGARINISVPYNGTPCQTIPAIAIAVASQALWPYTIHQLHWLARQLPAVLCLGPDVLAASGQALLSLLPERVDHDHCCSLVVHIRASMSRFF